MLRRLFILLALACATPAAADPVAGVGRIVVELRLSPEGRVGYTMSRRGRVVIEESRLGFLYPHTPQMLRNFAFAGKSTSSSDRIVISRDRLALRLAPGGGGDAARLVPVGSI